MRKPLVECLPCIFGGGHARELLAFDRWIEMSIALPPSVSL
jgi:hypothetical protein